MRLARLLAASAMMTLAARTLAAQDSFELEVYGHETAKSGEWELEPHFTFSAKGSTQFDGAVVPTNHLFRSALEVTHGLTQHWEVAAYGMFAMQSGDAPEFAGWRIRSRLSSPDTWRLPVDLALNAEVSYTKPVFDDHSYAFEITPIVSRRWGPFEAVVNASLESPLRGSDRGKWEFEPSARAALTLSPSVDVTLEYFSALGPLNAMDPLREQVHQLFPGVVLRLGDDFSWSGGVGLGLTGTGDRVVAKTALELEL